MINVDVRSEKVQNGMIATGGYIGKAELSEGKTLTLRYIFGTDVVVTAGKGGVAGGVVGELSGGTLSNIVSQAQVIAKENSSIGGIVGKLTGGAKIQDCYVLKIAEMNQKTWSYAGYNSSEDNLGEYSIKKVTYLRNATGVSPVNNSESGITSNTISKWLNNESIATTTTERDDVVYTTNAITAKLQEVLSRYSSNEDFELKEDSYTHRLYLIKNYSTKVIKDPIDGNEYGTLETKNVEVNDASGGSHYEEQEVFTPRSVMFNVTSRFEVMDASLVGDATGTIATGATAGGAVGVLDGGTIGNNVYIDSTVSQAETVGGLVGTAISGVIGENTGSFVVGGTLANATYGGGAVGKVAGSVTFNKAYIRQIKEITGEILSGDDVVKKQTRAKGANDILGAGAYVGIMDTTGELSSKTQNALTIIESYDGEFGEEGLTKIYGRYIAGGAVAWLKNGTISGCSFASSEDGEEKTINIIAGGNEYKITCASSYKILNNKDAVNELVDNVDSIENMLKVAHKAGVGGLVGKMTGGKIIGGKAPDISGVNVGGLVGYMGQDRDDNGVDTGFTSSEAPQIGSSSGDAPESGNVRLTGKGFAGAYVGVLNGGRIMKTSPRLGTRVYTDGNLSKIDSDTYLGGVVGARIGESSEVDDSLIVNNVKGGTYAGGIYGYSNGGGVSIGYIPEITDAYHVGGLVGRIDGGYFEAGSINGSDSSNLQGKYVGTLAGYVGYNSSLRDESTVEISLGEYSINMITIESKSATGGLVGVVGGSGQLKLASGTEGISIIITGNVNIKSGENFGGIVGYVDKDGKVGAEGEEKAKVKFNMPPASNGTDNSLNVTGSIGGVVGQLSGDAYVFNIIAQTPDVEFASLGEFDYNYGNIVGLNKGVVGQCVSEVVTAGEDSISIKGKSFGGIVAVNENGTVFACTTTGGSGDYLKVSSDQEAYFGGIVGSMSGGKIIDCENSMNLRSLGMAIYLGGLAGHISGGVDVINSKNSATVYANADNGTAGEFVSSSENVGDKWTSTDLSDHSKRDVGPAGNLTEDNYKEYTGAVGGLVGIAEGEVVFDKDCSSQGIVSGYAFYQRNTPNDQVYAYDEGMSYIVNGNEAMSDYVYKDTIYERRGLYVGYASNRENVSIKETTSSYEAEDYGNDPTNITWVDRNGGGKDENYFAIYYHITWTQHVVEGEREYYKPSVTGHKIFYLENESTPDPEEAKNRASSELAPEDKACIDGKWNDIQSTLLGRVENKSEEDSTGEWFYYEEGGKNALKVVSQYKDTKFVPDSLPYIGGTTTEPNQNIQFIRYAKEKYNGSGDNKKHYVTQETQATKVLLNLYTFKSEKDVGEYTRDFTNNFTFSREGITEG